MNESSKTRGIRSATFYAQFMSGRVLDIGCGSDLCVEHALPFDRAQGDANAIGAHFQSESFDCVHSSHCLEHMLDPVKCLRDWWSLVKVGGYLITVVPDEDLYEQGIWPSRFNSDHKHSFRLAGECSWSPVSFNLPEVISSLPRAKLIAATRQDNGYVYEWQVQSPSPPLVVTGLAKWSRRMIQRAGLISTAVDDLVVRATLAMGCPVDQTLGKALAQIEVIAQKVTS